jgi:hypothetical protein
MLDIDPGALKPFAAKYVWWKTADDAVIMPQRVIAQVMNIGDYDDVQRLAAEVGNAVLRDVLVRAEAGQFSATWIACRPCLCGRLRERHLHAVQGRAASGPAGALAAAAPAGRNGFCLVRRHRYCAALGPPLIRGLRLLPRHAARS